MIQNLNFLSFLINQMEEKKTKYNFLIGDFSKPTN